MKQINRNELTKEQIQKAMACETAEELMALAKSEGFEITEEQADAYMAELADLELDRGTLKKAAGGVGACYPVGDCLFDCLIVCSGDD